MSQHDFVIADQTMPAARTDINNALQALASVNQGGTAPSTTYSYMLWVDTSATPWVLKMRNAADDAWIALFEIDDTDDSVNFQADEVDVTDSGGFFTATEVEGVLQEVGAITHGQHTIWIPAGAMTPTTTNGAETATEELATNDVMVNGLDFDAATIEHAQFGFQAPKSSDESSGFIAQFLWKDATTAGSGDCVWGIKALAVGNDDAMDAAWGTGVTVTDTRIATADDLMVTSETASITPGGTWAEQDYLIFDVYRNASSGSDTLTQDARLIGVRLHYTTNANTDD